MGKGIGLIWKAAVTDAKQRPGQPKQEMAALLIRLGMG
jgi:hypothetical protein